MTPSRWGGGGNRKLKESNHYPARLKYISIKYPMSGAIIGNAISYPGISGTENHCRHLVPNVGNAISHQAFDPRFYGNRKLLPTFSSRRRKNNPGSHSNNHYDYRVIVEMANYPPCEATQVLNAKRCANPVAWKMKLGIANILAETTWRKLTQMT